MSDALPSGDVGAQVARPARKPLCAGAAGAPRAPRTVGADEGLLAFGANVPPGAMLTYNLSPSGDLAEAAANLFAMMRMLDRPGIGRIAVMPIPETGLGLAINDRLRRAAAGDGTVRRG